MPSSNLQLIDGSNQLSVHLPHLHLLTRCAGGFYGNPREVGGTCTRCQCHGNVDLNEAGHCDVITGACLRCQGNTTGTHCQVCQPGHYGDAIHAKNCTGENETEKKYTWCDVSGGGASSVSHE